MGGSRGGSQACAAARAARLVALGWAKTAEAGRVEQNPRVTDGPGPAETGTPHGLAAKPPSEDGLALEDAENSRPPVTRQHAAQGRGASVGQTLQHRDRLEGRREATVSAPTGGGPDARHRAWRVAVAWPRWDVLGGLSQA